MEKIGEKIIRLQDAKYKLIPNKNNESSIYINGDLASNLNLDDNDNVTFQIEKENLIKLLCFTFTFKERIYKKQDLFIFDLDWFEKYLKIIQNHFLLTSEFTFNVKKQSQGRYYFNNLEQSSGLNIRDFFIQDHIRLIFLDSTPRLIKIEFSCLSYIDVELNVLDDIHFDPFKTKNNSFCKIFYGSPGTGKSTKIKELTNGHSIIRTTFHPETDYYSFVGSYKPQMNGSLIKYSFTPQSFIKAYCKAWLNLSEPVYLLIEEINRGNCSQIFGDIFQCLERNSSGFSEYEIDIDHDLSEYLKSYFEENLSQPEIENYNLQTKSEAGLFNKISLPSNLYIYATMNTSDQSLFPMDSAFKRRWDWEYIPIDYDDAHSLIIEINDDFKYNYGHFISIINPKIKALTGSEDKQLGNRFVSPNDNIISFEQFRSKVLFYLWSEVYKDETNTLETIFKIKINDEEKEFQFGDLFSSNFNGMIPELLVVAFLDFNNVDKLQ